MTIFDDELDIGVSVGGIPTPETAAPLFSFRGYNQFQRGYGVNGGIPPILYTSAISLASNAAVKATFANDPRPSIQELYTNVATWSNTWNVAVDTNITNGYMLNASVFPYDQNTYINRCLYQSNLLINTWNIPATTP
jgi:hypothetical protein